MLKYSVKKRNANAPTSRANPASGSFPGVHTTRSGTPSTSTVSEISSLPTMKATRYVDIFMVGENRMRRLFPTSSIPTTGEFEMASTSGSTIRAISKTALRSGSSKQGKDRRASTDSNWVVAMVCDSPSGPV